MLDVHPPEHAAHTWPDFFIHIATIVLGLLIAIGLEQTVESFHHRHLLHTAKENLGMERSENRRYLAIDETHLNSNESQIEDSIAYLQALKAHRPLPAKAHVQWEWDGPQTAAWDTASASGALTLMSYEDAQRYAVVYGQQKVVNDQALLYVRDIYAVDQPLHGKKQLTDLSAAELDLMITQYEHALTDLRLLRDYCLSLDRVYEQNPAQ